MKNRTEKDGIGEIKIPAEAYYGIPKQIKKEAIGYLDKYLRKFVKI